MQLEQVPNWIKTGSFLFNSNTFAITFPLNVTAVKALNLAVNFSLLNPTAAQLSPDVSTQAQWLAPPACSTPGQVKINQALSQHLSLPSTSDKICPLQQRHWLQYHLDYPRVTIEQVSLCNGVVIRASNMDLEGRCQSCNRTLESIRVSNLVGYSSNLIILSFPCHVSCVRLPPPVW